MGLDMSDREQFTAWITKFALTMGILEKQVELCNPTMIKVPEGDGAYYHGIDWHRTREAAIARAKEMQAAKLKSIDKQRKRIAALKFE
jgi:hypothetical protein